MNPENVYTITEGIGGYFILVDGSPLVGSKGTTRYFASRNSARKAVSRLRRGITTG